MSLAGKAGKISAAVFGSRILGLVREAVFAHLFGAGAASDAYRAAFKIPNLLRDLFAEGALSTAFVATFTKKLEKEGDAPAYRLANLVFTFQWIVLGCLVLLGIAGAPWIVAVLAPGMAPETQELASSLTRVMFPFILLVGSAAIMMGLLNAKGRFGLPASASMFFNLGSIVSGVALAWCFDPHFGGNSIYGMAIGVLVGGFLQFAIQCPAAFKLGYSFRWVTDWKDPGLAAVLQLLGPAVIGASAVQINVLINTRFASEAGPGAISWLEYAFRLMQFPIGILGVAIATVTLPTVSRNAAQSDMGSFRKNLAHSLRLSFALTLPAAVGLAVVSDPLVAMLYERGKFMASDTAQTALALRSYAVGLAGYSAIKVVAPAFYALGDAKTPLRVSLFGIGLNIALNLVCLRIFHLGHAGLALATSGVALLNCTQLLLLMRGKTSGIEGKALVLTLIKSLIGCGVMTAVCWPLVHWELPALSPMLSAAAKTSLCLAVGIPAYGLTAWLLRMPEITEIVAAASSKILRKRG